MMTGDIPISGRAILAWCTGSAVPDRPGGGWDADAVRSDQMFETP